MAKIRTHYDNLKVVRNAPESVIKAAYKALCQTYHPDKFQGSKEEAERIMKLIKASYVVLLDPEKRVNHDRWINEQEAKAKQQSEKSGFHDFDEPTGQRYQHKHDNPKTEESTQSTYSKPNSTPPPNTNAESQSTPRTSGWLRFFARMFDVWWELLLVSYILAFVLFRFSTGFVDWLGNTPNADKTFVLLCIPIALILDVTIYSVFGNTPGKAWIGLKVKNAIGMPLNFLQYLRRNFKFYVSGFALGLPIIGLFPMVNQSIRLRRGQQASYDEATGFRVYEQPVGWLHKSTFSLAFICLFIVMLVLNIMGESAQQQSTLSTSQKISNNTTSQPEYQANNFETIFQQAREFYHQDLYVQALPLFQSLAEQGYAKAQNYLGRMYDNGVGVRQDYTQAVYWYQKAAQQGSASAQVSLGWYYMNGLANLSKDYRQAAYWNALGANNGDSEGANNLGWQYEHGLGVAQDLPKAAELYQYAINRGIELGVEKERIDEAKSRLANLTKHTQLTSQSDKKTPVSGASEANKLDNRFKRTVDSYKQGSSDALRYIEYLAKQGYAPAQTFLNSEKEKNTCIIKPVMTKAEIRNCQN